jgi:hypothetical protein
MLIGTLGRPRQRLGTGWTAQRSNLGRVRIFRALTDRLHRQYNGHRVIPGGKEIGRAHV